MSYLQVITIEEDEKWNSLVKSFINYDVYYLSGYTKAFQVYGDGQPILFYYKDKEIKAMNVVLKRDIEKNEKFFGKLPKNTLFDLITPYGYGGFLIEGNISQKALNNLDREYSSFCLQEGIICEFVRFHPVLNNSENLYGIYDILKLGNTITISLNSKEDIWANLTSKNRNVIRKAIKSGVNIYWGRDPKILNDFVYLYNLTMKKDEAIDYYFFNKDFFNSILYDLKNNSLIFYAKYEEKIIAMSIIIFSNKQMHYHLSASDRKYQHLAPTNLLLFEVACWGCENGYKTFHLGGGLGSREDSLFRFKKAFTRNSETHFSIGKKIFNHEKYEELVNIRSREGNFDIETDFFPKYLV